MPSEIHQRAVSGNKNQCALYKITGMRRTLITAVKRTGQSNRARSVQCAPAARRQAMRPAQLASATIRQAATKCKKAVRTGMGGNYQFSYKITILSDAWCKSGEFFISLMNYDQLIPALKAKVDGAQINMKVALQRCSLGGLSQTLDNLRGDFSAIHFATGRTIF
jgi:hypothetical protein